ncbi:hypothetical protein TNCV_3739811 [Trichonephila clavipes]|nr:hypothetical protein TNCV_3739811 [Trichonephila clavipes]
MKLMIEYWVTNIESLRSTGLNYTMFGVSYPKEDRAVKITPELLPQREMANNQSVRRHLDAFIRGLIIGKLEEGRSVTSVAARVRNCSQHRFTTLETISNYRNSYPGVQ